jgi:hypothetical protein
MLDTFERMGQLYVAFLPLFFRVGLCKRQCCIDLPPFIELFWPLLAVHVVSVVASLTSVVVVALCVCVCV